MEKKESNFCNEKKLYSLQNRLSHCYVWMFMDFFLHDSFRFRFQYRAHWISNNKIVILVDKNLSQFLILEIVGSHECIYFCENFKNYNLSETKMTSSMILLLFNFYALSLFTFVYILIHSGHKNSINSFNLVNSLIL